MAKTTILGNVAKIGRTILGGRRRRPESLTSATAFPASPEAPMKPERAARRESLQVAAPIDYMVQAELHRAAFEQGPDAIVVVDSAGTILAVNEQAELLTGRARRDLLRQKMEILIPADLRDKHKAHRAHYLRNPHRRLMGAELEVIILQQSEDGEVAIAVDVNLAPVPVSVGVVVIVSIRQQGETRWAKG